MSLLGPLGSRLIIFIIVVILVLDILIMTHELFRRSGVQEPHPLRGRHGGGGSLPKKRVFANFENSFRKFLKCVDCRPLLGRQQHAHLKISKTTTSHHQARLGSDLDPCSFPRVLSGKASEEGGDAERGAATEAHQVLELGHMCDPPPPCPGIAVD